MLVLLYVAMFLCFLSVVVKVSLLEWWKSVLLGILLLGFCLLMVPFSVKSSRIFIEGFLTNYEARQYVAILASLECALAFGFAFRNWGKERVTKDVRATRMQLLRPQLLSPLWWLQKHYVSLLILPTLFFLQTQILYALPGINFYIPAAIIGGGALVLIPLLAWLFKAAFPIRAHREESLLFISVALSVLVLISTNHDEILTTRPEYGTRSSYSEVILTTSIFLTLFILGFLFRRIRRKRSH